MYKAGDVVYASLCDFTLSRAVLTYPEIKDNPHSNLGAYIKLLNNSVNFKLVTE